ncbi:hypothetical protein AVEN_187644-1 [Araneus ventricosus]|uniref:Uncharacterized protein n=1 Tax=Araneus ventricosus TaxID=182803 RepID=A0A4Y2Q4X3_ARAVE|nr:hypothetical protein AVEN_187644-1 [Araneus ventricosus]
MLTDVSDSQASFVRTEVWQHKPTQKLGKRANPPRTINHGLPDVSGMAVANGSRVAHVEPKTSSTSVNQMLANRSDRKCICTGRVCLSGAHNRGTANACK